MGGSRVGGASVLLVVAASHLASAAAAGLPAPVATIVESRCAGCHGGDHPEAGVKLDGEWTAERLVAADGNTWFRALHEIESGRMPPEEEEQPTADIRPDATRGGGAAHG